MTLDQDYIFTLQGCVPTSNAPGPGGPTYRCSDIKRMYGHCKAKFNSEAGHKFVLDLARYENEAGFGIWISTDNHEEVEIKSACKTTRESNYGKPISTGLGDLIGTLLGD